MVDIKKVYYLLKMNEVKFYPAQRDGQCCQDQGGRLAKCRTDTGRHNLGSTTCDTPFDGCWIASFGLYRQRSAEFCQLTCDTCASARFQLVSLEKMAQGCHRTGWIARDKACAISKPVHSTARPFLMTMRRRLPSRFRTLASSNALNAGSPLETRTTSSPLST